MVLSAAPAVGTAAGGDMVPTAAPAAATAGDGHDAALSGLQRTAARPTQQRTAAHPSRKKKKPLLERATAINRPLIQHIETTNGQ